MAPPDQQRKTPEEYLKAPYGRVLLRNDDGTYTAEMLEFTGCFAEGDTAEEAIRNLDQSAREWIEASLALGHEIPEPFSTRGYSGTISLRIPKAIHRQAARMAERNGVSLNQYLLAAVSARVGADDLLNRLAQKLTTNTTINVGVVSMSSTNAGVFTFGNDPGSTGGIPLANFGMAVVAGVSQGQWHSSGSGLTVLQGSGVGATGTLTSAVSSGSLNTRLR